MRLRPELCGPCVLLCALAACSERLDVAAVPALAGADAAVDPVACAAPNDALAMDSGECAGDWLAAHLGQTLCSCGDYAGNAGFTSGSFLGSRGVYVDDVMGGYVRIDGALNLGADAHVGGGLSVAGAAGLVLSSGQSLRVVGPLEVAADLDATTATLELLGDAHVGGQLLADSLQVNGTLTMTDPSQLQVGGTSTIGTLAQGAVDVAPGCACDGFEPWLTEASAAPDDTDDVVVCGSLRRGPLESDGDVTVSGAGVLQIDGDVGVGGRLTFAVPELGTLFVIVRGNLRADDGLEARAEDPRSRVHLLVAGNGTVQLGGASWLTGSLYAPAAELVLSGSMELWGALLARRSAVSAQLDLHFDTSLAAALADSCR